MERLWQDVRFAVRTLRAQPTFAITAVLTLALGVGASATIFSVFHAVLIKPLPYPEPERLVMLWERMTRDGRLGGVSPANFVDWRTRSVSFQGLAAVQPLPDFTLLAHGEPERVAGAAVSPAFFPLLGTALASGRNFVAEEEQPGRNFVAIISHSLWRRRFAGDPSVIGRTVELNGTPYTIVGVLQRDFQLASKASDFQGRTQFDVWTPLTLNLQRLQRGTRPLRVFGRLRAGTRIEEAQAELDVIAKALEQEYPTTNRERAIYVVKLSEHVVRDVRVPLLALLVAVGLVWLIACVNVANLLLTRATMRQKEMAVRLALGVGRFRLGQQLVTESLLLASAGTIIGTGMSWWSLKLLVRQLPLDLPRVSEIGLNIEVVGFISLVSVLTGVVFGCVPLMSAVEASESLKTGRHTSTRAQGRVRNALVVAQISLACILLAGAGLMGRSLWNLLNVSPGFGAEQVLTAHISLVPRHYPDVRRIASFQREFLARLENLPGVESAGFGGYLPLGGTDNSWAPTIEAGAPRAPGEFIQYRPVTPGYIETLAIPLRRGRSFSPADDEEAPAVALINEAAAQRYWPNADAIGRRLQIDGPPWRTIIGIVGNVRHTRLDVDAKPELYLPFAQLPYPTPSMTVAIRTAGEPLALTPAIRAILAQIDPAQALARVQTMEDVVRSSVGESRVRVVLVGTFAIAALMLASIGVYGVMNYLVSQRTREFGVRAALGASRGDLLGLVLQRSVVLIVAGLGLGLLGAISLGRLLRSLLFGVTSHDFVTLAFVSVVLATSAIVASYVPARRAAQVEAAQALRMD